jgi:hypothetical protein
MGWLYFVKLAYYLFFLKYWTISLFCYFYTYKEIDAQLFTRGNKPIFTAFLLGFRLPISKNEQKVNNEQNL